MTGSRDSNRSEPPGGGREAGAESSGEQRESRRNTNGPRGRTRVMSVRVNAKSNRHRKPRLVEPGGLARKCVFLLGETSSARAPGGVSRGHSSADAGRKPGGAKGRRTVETAQFGELGLAVRGAVRNSGGSGLPTASRRPPSSREGRWIPARKTEAGAARTSRPANPGRMKRVE